MLSLVDCRALLNKPDLNDAQLLEIRDTLYSFANLMIGEFRRNPAALRRLVQQQAPTGVEPYFGA